jgi:hypothetical protein
LAAAAIGFVDSAKAVSFGYASTVHSFIHFPGNHTFSFTPNTNNFQVGSGSLAGAFGEITGTFTIGTSLTLLEIFLPPQLRERERSPSEIFRSG